MVNNLYRVLRFADAKRSQTTPSAADRSHASIRAPQNSCSVSRRCLLLRGLWIACSKPAAIWTGLPGGWTGGPVHELPATALRYWHLDRAARGSRPPIARAREILLLTESQQPKSGTYKNPLSALAPCPNKSFLRKKTDFFVPGGIEHPLDPLSNFARSSD